MQYYKTKPLYLDIDKLKKNYEIVSATLFYFISLHVCVISSSKVCQSIRGFVLISAVWFTDCEYLCKDLVIEQM